jgi:hypothetical protein
MTSYSSVRYGSQQGARVAFLDIDVASGTF